MTVTIASATEELRAAEEHQAELLRAVGRGDRKISGADLAEADNAVRLAVLRLEAATQIAAEAAEQARLDRIEEWRGFITEHFGPHDGGIIDKFDDAVAALVPLVEAIQERNDGRKEVIDDLLKLGPLPQDLNVTHGFLRLTGLDVQIDAVDPVTLVAEAAVRALTATGEKAGALTPVAQMGVDAHVSRLFGIADRDDGVTQPHGPSDWIRHIARRVAERDA